MTRKLPKLRVGVNYRIHYRTQLGNYQWWEKAFVAKYIGSDDRMDKELFSMRPLAGTQDLARESILWIYEMPHSTQPKLPWKIRRLEKPDG